MFRRVARRQATSARTAQIAIGIRRLYQRGIESFWFPGWLATSQRSR